MTATKKKKKRAKEEEGEARAATGTDGLRFYIRQISRYKQLTADEEKELARRIHAGDREALNRMVEANLRFVVSFGKRYRNLGLSFLDIIHEGNLGLIEAAKRFDPERNVRFISYAVWWIRQAILHALTEQTRILRLPQRLVALRSKLKAAHADLASELDRPATDEEAAARAEISKEELAALQWTPNEEVSLSTTVGEDGGIELGDTLEQDTVPHVEIEMIQASMVRQIQDMVNGLDDKEREVIIKRFGLDDEEPRTLQEIGNEMKITRERVRQIESRAKEKLRRMRQSQTLKGYLN
ncbi:MAG: RNA polymerase sigma factor RpoD/SigA [Vicinamibacteria bacterium]|jgi:RNA polymerase primary sigma factor|nr:RNA polymerase sigma factor RpoD/SigA [Vicinamibacteria bacterium]